MDVGVFAGCCIHLTIIKIKQLLHASTDKLKCKLVWKSIRHFMLIKMFRCLNIFKHIDIMPTPLKRTHGEKMRQKVDGQAEYSSDDP